MRIIFSLFFFFIIRALAWPQQKPNILLIAIDDMNNYVGCMGGPAITPNIDALAKKAILFNNAYCAAPACNPSRVAIMTGLRPETSGQYTNQGNFRDVGNNKNILTLPQKLMAAGYETIAAGKIFHMPNGLNKEPHAQSDPVSWNYQFAGQTGAAVPADTYLTKAGAAKWLGDDTVDYTNGKTVEYLAKASIWGANNQKKEQTGDWKMSEVCANYLQQKHDKPFFFALGFSKPHQPLIAPKEFFDLYPLDKIVYPKWDAGDMDDIPAINKKNFSSLFVEKVRKHKQLQLAYQAYLACMSFTDACIGNVMEALAKSKYANNTIVIFFTDHGFQLGQKNRWEKYSLWKLSTNSPLIIYIPNNKNNGTICSEAVSLIDIHATVLEACNISFTKKLESISLAPLLKAPTSERKQPAIITHDEGNNAVVWKQYNYIRYKDGSEEFYDHAKDNAEYDNRADDKTLQEIKEKLKKFIPVVQVPQPANQMKQIGEETRGAAGWENLFDEKSFSGWIKYLGIPHESTVVTGFQKDDKGKYKNAFGVNNDPLNVYAITTIDGEPAIRVTGQVFGTLITEKEYENFHIRLQFKWGEKKWAPRLNEPRDAGLLYHGFGAPGSVEHRWHSTQECQIQQGDTGDYWPIGDVTIDIPSVKTDTSKWWVYSPGASLRNYFFSNELSERRCMKKPDNEKNHGEWNTVEVIAHGDSSVHIVNGKVVMRLYHSRKVVDGVAMPLTKGKIALQSEGAELYYRKVQIRKIEAIPQEYLSE